MIKNRGQINQPENQRPRSDADGEIEWQTPDKNFKLESAHYAVLKNARANGDKYSLKSFVEKVKREHPGDTKKQQALIKQNQSLLSGMEKAGVIKKIDDDTYLINPMTPKPKEFEPGKYHMELLKKHKGGRLVMSDIKKEYAKRLKGAPLERQKKFADKMTENLFKNGYLVREDKGVYVLTEKALKFLEKGVESKRKKPEKTEHKTFKVSAFDLQFIKLVGDDGKIDIETVKDEKKRISLEKRLKSLEENGLVFDKKMTPVLKNELERIMLFLKDNRLTIEKLSPEQKKVMTDMRLFMNLSFHQIKTHIYGGDARKAREELDMLVKHKLLERDKDSGIYIFDFAGVKMSNEMFPKDTVKYKTKLKSRKEEIEHDMMVYDAFKHQEKMILDAGGETTQILNDRQMRSEDARKYGAMRDGYPDLRVHYKIPGDDKEKTIDIEIDMGYDTKTIVDKIGKMTAGNHIGSLGWYCKKISQVSRVLKGLGIHESKTKKTSRSRQIDIFWMDDKCQMHKMKVK